MGITQQYGPDLGTSIGLPAQGGHAGQFLTTDGTMASWAAILAAGTISGANGQVAFFNGASSIISSPNFLWNNGTNTFTVTGDAVIAGKLTVGGAIDPTSLSLVGGANDAFIDSAAGQSAPISAVGHGRLIYNNVTHTFQTSVNGGAYVDIGSGGGSGFPVPDNVEGIFGTTFPFGLMSTTAGVNGSARLTIPDGKILIISKQSDIGVDFIDVPVTFTAPTIFIAGEDGLANEGLVLGSGSTPFGDPHVFVLQTFGGDNLDGSPENANGTTLALQASNGGSLGGIPGQIQIIAGDSNFGNQDGGDIVLNVGRGTGIGDVGFVILPSVNGFGGNMVFDGGNPPGLSQTGQARIYYDSGGMALMISSNGGAYTTFAGGGGNLVSATLATASGAIANTVNNSSGFTFNIPIVGVDAFAHDFRWSVAGTTLADFQGTGDGVGGLASTAIQLGGSVPTSFNFSSGNQLTPAANNLDFIYQGGKGGSNNPGFNGGRGSNFQAGSGDGGDGFDNSHAAGDAGSIIFSGGTGGTGSTSFTGGFGGTVSLQAGPGGASGGFGIGNYGDVVLTANLANITIIGTNSSIVTTVAANESNAWQVRDTSAFDPNYIQINTNTGFQSIFFGNTINNPVYNFVGTGSVDIASGLHVGGSFAVQGPTTTHGTVDMQLGPFLWTVEKVASLLAGTENLQTNTFTIPDLGADSSAVYTGIENDIGTNVLAHNLTGEIIGVNTQILIQQGLSTVNAVTGYGSVIAIANAGTITQVNGFTSFLSNPGAGTIIDYRGMLLKNPAQPTNGNVYGLYIENQTQGVNNFGIIIEGATNAALWVQGGLSIFDSWIIENQFTSGAANDLAVSGNKVIVTGAVQINRIATPPEFNTRSTTLELIFTSNPVVKHNQAGGGGFSAILLDNSTDFTAAANSILVLTWDSSQGVWQELSRKNA